MMKPASAGNELLPVIDDLQAAAQKAIHEQSVETFAALEQYVNRFDSLLRELQQSVCAGRVEQTIRRLEGEEPLTNDDRDLIRSLVVGDAQAYLQCENNLQDWITELERLMTEMTTLAPQFGPDGFTRLRGLTHDAGRLLPAIRSYMDDKKRVELFEGAMARLDDGNRKQLARMLREKLDSPTR